MCQVDGILFVLVELRSLKAPQRDTWGSGQKILWTTSVALPCSKDFVASHPVSYIHEATIFFIWKINCQLEVSPLVWSSVDRVDGGAGSCWLYVHYSSENLSGLMLKIEAVVRRCSAEKVLLEISQNSQENTCASVSFLIKLQAWGISKNAFFYRTTLVAASVKEKLMLLIIELVLIINHLGVKRLWRSHKMNNCVTPNSLTCKIE